MTTWNEAGDKSTSWDEAGNTSTTAAEAGDESTTWSEAETVYPKIGGTPGTVGDEWDELWIVDYDMTWWERAGDESTTWTENS